MEAVIGSRVTVDFEALYNSLPKSKDFFSELVELKNYDILRHRDDGYYDLYISRTADKFICCTGEVCRVLGVTPNGDVVLASLDSSDEAGYMCPDIEFLLSKDEFDLCAKEA